MMTVMPREKRDTHAIGNRTEAVLLSYLLASYETVLVPFGDGQRYDLVVEGADGFLRIQCKTGWLRAGGVNFNTSSSTYHRPPVGERGRSRCYRGEADFFGIWCPENCTAYLVPVEDVGQRLAVLRIDPPLNNQAKNIRWAKDYILPPPGKPS